MAKDKVKGRVILPAIVASVGGPAYVEGEVELEADVAEAAEALGGFERSGRKAKATGRKPGRPRKTVAVKQRTAKTTEPAPSAGPMTKADVPGAG